MTTLSMSTYVQEKQILPEWIREERLDYCDPGLRHFRSFKSLFHRTKKTSRPAKA